MNIFKILITIGILAISPMSQNEKLSFEKLEPKETIEKLGQTLLLEENEKVLDYRYIEKNKIEVFSQINEKYYRKFYIIKDNKIEKLSEEEIELPKTGLKTKE